MKKLVAVFLISSSLLVVSCQKEDIKPNAVGTMDAPGNVYKSNADATTGPTGTSGKTIGGGSQSGGSDITDPNNDPDGNKKNNK